MHGSNDVAHLADRHPTVTPERLVAQLIPPPTFADVSFDTYRPDPAEPSQAAAVQSCRQFCAQAAVRRAGKKKLFGKREVLPGVGLYLDGGFGVGKTHLLASTYYTLSALGEAPTAFATFGELTQLAGVFGYNECIDLLAEYVVVCIDEASTCSATMVTTSESTERKPPSTVTVDRAPSRASMVCSMIGRPAILISCLGMSRPTRAPTPPASTTATVRRVVTPRS